MIDEWNVLNYPIDDLKRIWNKILVPENLEECWEWQGATGATDNYGRTTFKGRPYLVHRFIYECYFGIIPKGLYICHDCDNPKCVNPNHLFKGTQIQNMHDMIHKGRGGKNNLTDDQIIELLTFAQNNKMSMQKVANKFNITSSYLRRIIYGQYRKSISNNFDLKLIKNNLRTLLTDNIVRQIRQDINLGIRRKDILSKYNILWTVYDNIKNYDTYKHVTI
jgi:AraC-like DNA-binding protein